MIVFYRLGEPVINKTRRRSSIVVIPPMQICPGIVSLTFPDLSINYFIIFFFKFTGDLLVYSKVLTQRNNLLGITLKIFLIFFRFWFNFYTMISFLYKWEIVFNLELNDIFFCSIDNFDGSTQCLAVGEGDSINFIFCLQSKIKILLI